MRKCLVLSTRWYVTFVLLIYPISLFAQIQFQEVTDSAGPFHTGESRGATWCDINSDGFVDILASNHRFPTSVYRNNGDGTFSEVSKQIDVSGVWQQINGNDTHGIACADFDNDGDQDLLHTTGTCCPPYFLLNEGGLFTNAVIVYNIPNDFEGQLASWFDFTQDGLLDFTFHKLNRSVTMQQNPDNTFSVVTHSLASGSCQGGSDMGQLSDLDNDGDAELVCIRNKFVDDAFAVTPTPWMNIHNTLPTVGLITDSAIADFDGNLEPDFFLTRGRKVPSQAISISDTRMEAYLTNSGSNDKGFTFQNSGLLTVRIDTHQFDEQKIFIGSGGIHPVDTDTKVDSFTFLLDPNDLDVTGIKSHTPGVSGDRGIYIGYHIPEETWEFQLSPKLSQTTRVYVVVSSTTTIENVTESAFKNTDGAYYPALLMNNNGGFTDERAVRGFVEKIRCNSGVPGDFDNDGDVDLYVVCREGVENLENKLYVNDGTGNFSETGSGFGAEGVIGAGIASNTGTGDVAAVADYDNDGRLDLFVTNGIRLRPLDEGGGPDQLFKNTTTNGNNWLQLELVGAGSPNSNRDGIGAKVYVTVNGKTQLRQQNGKYHRWSQDDKRIHFGIGAASIINELKVEWPSGIVDSYSDVTPSRRYRVNEGGLLEDITNGANIPVISVSSGADLENVGKLRFFFTLSQPTDEIVSVDFTTSDDVAIATEDYLNKSGSITFNAGQVKKIRNVTIIDDTVAEADETFLLSLSNPQNATIGIGIGTGTIYDNDGIDPCGDPGVDPTQDFALFLWQECNGSGEWHVRAMTGNTANNRSYIGSFVSDQSFLAVVPIDLDSNDSLNNTPDTEINFTLKMKQTQIDGFDFQYPPAALVCFNFTNLPGAAEILVGGNRTIVSPPFDLLNFASCMR